MKQFITRLLLCTGLTACSSPAKKTTAPTETKFNKTQWAIQEDGQYPWREQMLQYLIDSVRLHGLNSAQVINLLGQPDYTNNGHLYYRVGLKTFPGIPFPVGVRTLVIKLGKDSTVEWRKMHN